MQSTFSLFMAALLPPAFAFAQDPESRNAHFQTTCIQLVAKPGYDMDRGPASFHALRLHWES